MNFIVLLIYLLILIPYLVLEWLTVATEDTRIFIHIRCKKVWLPDYFQSNEEDLFHKLPANRYKNLSILNAALGCL